MLQLQLNAVLKRLQLPLYTAYFVSIERFVLCQHSRNFLFSFVDQLVLAKMIEQVPFEDVQATTLISTLLTPGTGIVYPAGATAEAASGGDQALEVLQAAVTQPLPDGSKVTPSKRKGASHGMMIVVCDEMDQLMSSAKEVLYDLFFLPQVYCLSCRHVREVSVM